MVPNISPSGRSFRGAGAYHLHDKPMGEQARPRTTHRVAFTATRNLANDDPHAALDEMWRTAADAAHLKAAAGAKLTGRKTTSPVKTISLAWAPEQAPTRDDMTAAADDFLRAMGWHQHQAVYAAHSDTAHPHLHIILNRVHPDSGRTLNDWQDRKRAQAWALAYERQAGAVLCKGRALRHETGAPAPAGLPYRQAKLVAQLRGTGPNAVARGHRARSRPDWPRHFRRQRAVLASLARQRRSVQRVAVALARAADAPAAWRLLDRFQRRYARASRSLAMSRAGLAHAEYASLKIRLEQAPAPQRPAANDNRAAAARPQPTIATEPSRLHGSRAADPANALSLAALQRAERCQLRATHVAESAAMRQHRRAATDAVLRARSEIALAFASRWADIARLPAMLRAAAAAALKAEQAAALSARMRYHLARLQATQRMQRLALSHEQTHARRALAHRHKLAWTAAATAINITRSATGPPQRPQPKPLGPTHWRRAYGQGCT